VEQLWSESTVSIQIDRIGRIRRFGKKLPNANFGINFGYKENASTPSMRSKKTTFVLAPGRLCGKTLCPVPEGFLTPEYANGCIFARGAKRPCIDGPM